ncbi:class I SAM-dependent methyltransferase [Arenimonas sp.]|uniref:class I SAM-dependent methyltransferase n=1 Tax=Arenimonas sp. TaxID=1872635 RepID=UPI0039E5F893
MKNISNSPGLHYLLWRVGLVPAQTETTEEEKQALAELARGRRRLLEIGVWHGANTRRFRSVMADDGVLYAVDPFPRGRFGFSWERMVAHSEVGRERRGAVRFLEMTSAQAAESLRDEPDEPFDFIFIDGDHSYEGLRTDWSLWSERVAPNGVIALHDSRSTSKRVIDHMGSVRFTQEVVRTDKRFRLKAEVDSLTVMEPVGIADAGVA